MNVKIILLLAGLVSVATFGQGTILFNTRVVGQVDAPVSRPDGTGAGEGYRAQLFLITGSGASSAYTPLFPATTFRTTSATARFYVVQPNDPVVVPGVPAGAQATVVLRAWAGSETYEGTSWKGQSNPITITLGGVPPGGGAPIQDALLVGLLGFNAPLPEPSTGALVLLGAAALLCRRKRRG
jgi:hypothetical protein